jgi:hypothetical protein
LVNIFFYRTFLLEFPFVFSILKLNMSMSQSIFFILPIFRKYIGSCRFSVCFNKIFNFTLIHNILYDYLINLLLDVWLCFLSLIKSLVTPFYLSILDFGFLWPDLSLFSLFLPYRVFLL